MSSDEILDSDDVLEADSIEGGKRDENSLNTSIRKVDNNESPF